jgi:hypothetical protein
MNKTKNLFLITSIGILMLVPSTVYAHKLIPTDGTNISISNSLEITDPSISWAMYEEINGDIRYYSFYGKQGELLYASIVIPKLENLIEFTPSVAFIGVESHLDLIEEFKILKPRKSFDFSLPEGYNAYVFDYDGIIPSKEFYEPFGQVTYWERQEINFDFPVDGTYYLAVFDENSTPGKYALAVGTVEDFSVYDFFTILPYAWFETKLFFNDYLSAISIILILIGLLCVIGFLIYRKFKK